LQDDFTEEDLNETFEQGGTRRDLLKDSVQKLFGEFPINPLTVEQVIPIINRDIDAHNKKVLKEIAKIESKEELTEQDENTILELRNQILTFRLGTFENTREYETEFLKKEGEINAKLQDNGKT